MKTARALGAFTLVRLVLVIAAIGLLAAAVTPTFVLGRPEAPQPAPDTTDPAASRAVTEPQLDRTSAAAPAVGFGNLYANSVNNCAAFEDNPRWCRCFSKDGAGGLDSTADNRHPLRTEEWPDGPKRLLDELLNGVRQGSPDYFGLFLADSSPNVLLHSDLRLFSNGEATFLDVLIGLEPGLQAEELASPAPATP